MCVLVSVTSVSQPHISTPPAMRLIFARYLYLQPPASTRYYEIHPMFTLIWTRSSPQYIWVVASLDLFGIQRYVPMHRPPPVKPFLPSACYPPAIHSQYRHPPVQDTIDILKTPRYSPLSGPDPNPNTSSTSGWNSRCRLVPRQLVFLYGSSLFYIYCGHN